MLRKMLLLPISLLVLTQSIIFGQSKPLTIYEDADAYEVYSAILSSPEERRLSKSKNFVIRLETNKNFGGFLDTQNGSSVCLRPDDESKKIIGTALDDYVKVNKTSWRLRDSFKLELPYKLVSSEILSSILKKEGQELEDTWTEFYKQYPDSGGFIELSAVGFNAEKTVAVVSQGRWCRLLCGNGAYHVLQKKEGKWIPLVWKGESCSWIS